VEDCIGCCVLCLVCRFVVKEQQNVYVPFLGLYHCDVFMLSSLVQVVHGLHCSISSLVNMSVPFLQNHGHDMGKACK